MRDTQLVNILDVDTDICADNPQYRATRLADGRIVVGRTEYDWEGDDD
jgi:hypothetical protein